MIQLIDCLSSLPILGYPDMTQPFILHCDASQDGLRAIVYQRQGGKMAGIAYTWESVQALSLVHDARSNALGSPLSPE